MLYRGIAMAVSKDEQNSKSMAIGIAVIVIIIAAAFVLLYTGGASQPGGASTSTSGSGQQASMAQFPILMTDPAQVPNGTTALNIGYSSVQALYAKGASNGWVNAAGSGSLNLMSVINVSSVIASASVPNGSSVSEVRFNITSANIVINGTMYPLTVPSSQIIAHIKGSQQVNASSSVLVDLSPVVITVFTNNATLFIMVPSVRAIVAGGAPASSSARLQVGARADVSASESAGLEAAAPNITITSATLNVAGNVTTLSIAVKNNANASVELRHVLMYGNESFHIPAFITIGENSSASDGAGSNDPVGVGASGDVRVDAGAGINGSSGGMGESASGRMMANESGRMTVDTSEPENISIHAFGANVSSEAELHMAANAFAPFVQGFRMVNFLVNSNGSLELPFMSCLPPTAMSSNATAGSGFMGEHLFSSTAVCEGNEFELDQNVTHGLVIAAGQSATLTFSGKINLGSGLAGFMPIAGDRYRLVVAGGEGAQASTTVSAT